MDDQWTTTDDLHDHKDDVWKTIIGPSSILSHPYFFLLSVFALEKKRSLEDKEL